MDGRSLWMAVLYRAVVDANYIGRNTNALLDKQQAHSWITSGGKDYLMVCTYAGVDPDFFRDAYMNGRIVERTPRGRQAKTLPDDFFLTDELC